jgi:8-oxo-dGTP diphosphatase
MGRVDPPGYPGGMAGKSNGPRTTGRLRIRVVSAEIERNGAFLLTQRAAHAVLPLLWEFPGGRVREGESDKQALKRAVSERVGCSAKVGELTMEVTHPYDDYDLVLAVYRCDIGIQVPEPQKVASLAWVPPGRFSEYDFPGADQQTIDLLLGR